jgi:hypothetical protein
MTETILKPIEDTDMDSLFILPLSIIPLSTPQLKSARIVKNSALHSVVEIFRDAQAGSGQVSVEDLPAAMGWDPQVIHPDLAILRRLALMPSYDVYSLRITIRAQKIPLNDIKALTLSAEKIKQLTEYMMTFTRPLLQMIYAGDNIQVNSYDDLMRLFRDPDIARARDRLTKLADTLGVPLAEVPGFLEDYGDTFMSLSYYRHCLDRLEPYLSACLEAIPPLRKNLQLSRDQNLMRMLTTITQAINQVSGTISGRLEQFDRRTQQMWQNISKEEFQTVKTMIEQYHTTIGGALCGLTVKMNSWARAFPHAHAGGPIKRADFMSTEMTQGIDLIRSMTAAFKTADAAGESNKG